MLADLYEENLMHITGGGQGPLPLEILTEKQILADLKEKYGADILLIPIATDMDILSLELLLMEYDIRTMPTVVINEKYFITETENLDTIEGYLKKSEGDVDIFL